MRWVPAGEFRMGAPAEQSLQICVDTSSRSSSCRIWWFESDVPHAVYLDAFYIDVYEVTKAQFADFLNQEGNQVEGGVPWLNTSSFFTHITEAEGVFTVDEGYADYPVVEVSWYGAQAYCQWRGARLPTEAQWEKAARGTDERSYPWGDEFDGANANWAATDNGDGFEDIAPVGSFPQEVGPYGMHDMAGNVWEWTADFYNANYYSNSPYENPMGPPAPDSEDYIIYVKRGGAYAYDAFELYSASRSYSEPTYTEHSIGFRCASAP
jgi:formylglycine-generating enzyme required for sulfatase activity